MSTKTLKILVAVVAILIVAFLILEQGRNSQSVNASLLRELKSQMNDISSLVVRDGNGTITIEKANDAWSIPERNHYAADLGILRSVLFSLADARVIEKKTSNPEKYGLIGVNNPADDDSEAVELTISGGDFEYVVILGKVAQSKYRYARIASDPQSVLIDQNPDLPDSAGGWLDQRLLDISLERIERVTIEHSDGESIDMEASAENPGSFKLVSIPPGRELSYPGVANGMGGALSDLSLEDVRPAPAGSVTPDVVTTFSTEDGLIVVAAVVVEESLSWVSISASVETSDEVDEVDEVDEDVVSEAEQINSRVTGWQYALPDYKLNLLKRRFEDLLKAEEG